MTVDPNGLLPNPGFVERQELYNKGAIVQIFQEIPFNFGKSGHDLPPGTSVTITMQRQEPKVKKRAYFVLLCNIVRF